MTKTWKCEVCGYVHTGAEPPERCPICGADRESFSLMEAVTVAVAVPDRAVSSWICNICGYRHEGNEPPASCPVCGADRSLFRAEKQAAASKGKATDVKRVVIVGAGIAGVTAAEQARLAAPDVRITLISKEAGLPYFRLNLTRFLAGEVPEEDLTMHDLSWFEAQRIERIEGEAKAIDREGRRLILHDGQSFDYDRLILANGSHPFVPPLPGVTRHGVMTLRTLVHAKMILERAALANRVVCIGGGLLGLETAGALSKQGKEVTLLEGHAHLLPRQLAEPAGLLLQKQVENAGITVRTQARTKEIMGDETVRAVLLQDGEEIPADLVVLATGVRPNSSLARQTGLAVRTGVIVDDRMFSSDPHILACGDVAEHLERLYGIWPASYAQGSVAGVNAVGGGIAFSGIPPSNRLSVLDVNLFSIGQFQSTDASYEVFEEGTDGIYRRFVCHDGRMIGANLYGDTDLAVLVKEAIEQRKQIPELSGILDKIPQFAAFCGLRSVEQEKKKGNGKWQV